MELVLFGIGALLVLGVGLAIYERRKKITLLKHDLTGSDATQNETDREAIRATDAMRHKIMFDNFN